VVFALFMVYVPTISRRCEGGVRLSPVTEAGTCQ
jgi:hypothetical protein